AALTISGSLTVNSAGTTLTTNTVKPLTVSGAIGGTGNLIVNNNSTAATGIALSAVNNIGAITNSGTGAGTASISGVIGTNVTSLTENGVSSLLLSGASANTFTGPASVVNGTLILGKTAVLAINGNLAIGDGTGAASSAIVQLSGTGGNQ